MNQRNYLLELWRFFFCMAVLGLHFFSETSLNFFHAGYLGVEFFFLVSGYFIGVYYEKHLRAHTLPLRLKSVLSYSASRLKRLYPFYCGALFLALAVRTLIHHYRPAQILSQIKSALAEFFMLQWTPLGNEILIYADWFVPAVFFGGIFFVLLLALTGKAGGYILAPLISFFLYCYYFLLIGKIDIIYSYHSILRGIAGIGLGVFIYFISQQLRKLTKQLSACSMIRSLFCIAASLIFLGVFIYTNFGHRSKWDFLIIFLYAVALLLLMTGTVRLPESLEKVFAFLGKTTYPVYVFQMPVIELVRFALQCLGISL